jgi:PAS domain-containing protein
MLTGAAILKGENQGVSFVLNLTELKAAKRALRETEQLWRATFEANPTMYFMVDRAGLIGLVNTFGAESELIEQPWLNACYEPERDAMRAHAEDCFREVGRMM